MKVNEDIASQLESTLIDNEFRTSETNKEDENADFEDYVDMMDGVRTGKQYDWQSNISIPEFAAHLLTQSSIDANAMFSTRDFVEVYVQSSEDEALLQADAQKELINRTMNQEHLNFFQKYMRAKTVSNISGRCFIRTDWEKTSKKAQTSHREVLSNGKIELEPVFESVTDRDRFNFDVIDNRNVFMDNSYCYSLSEKAWVYIRSETNLNSLKVEAKQKGYFNLDKITKTPTNQETDTSTETYNQLTQFVKHEELSPQVDKLERYGKFWFVISERDPEDRRPLKGKIGINASGEPVSGAELHEGIITFVKHEGNFTLIGAKLTPFVDMNGNPFKPLIRGINYIHPTIDGGIGDGQYAKDIQVAINDTFNMSADRVRFATTPIVKLAKSKNPDLTELEFEPGAVWDLESADDVQELRVDDNIQGAIQQIGMLTAQLDKTTSIFPTTQGALPQDSSTTATAIAGSENRSSQRGNYRALSFEFTFLKELYWQISHMTMRFADPETGELLMGSKLVDFDPTRADYTYKPVSQAVETEFSRTSKIQKHTQLLQIVSGITNTNTRKLVNKIVKNIFELMGDEFVNIEGSLLDEDAGAKQAKAEQAAAEAQAQPQAQPAQAQSLADFETAASNQNGQPQGAQQVLTRQAAPGQ